MFVICRLPDSIIAALPAPMPHERLAVGLKDLVGSGQLAPVPSGVTMRAAPSRDGCALEHSLRLKLMAGSQD